MTAQPRKMSEIMKEMSEILLRHPSEVPSSEAAQVALFFANVAWNESVGMDHAREGYRNVWEAIEADNPELWNELKSNDINAMINEIVLHKKTHFPDDQRRILICGILDGNIRVEWLKAAAPGVDSRWEMRLYGLVRMGDLVEAAENCLPNILMFYRGEVKGVLCECQKQRTRLQRVWPGPESAGQAAIRRNDYDIGEPERAIREQHDVRAEGTRPAIPGEIHPGSAHRRRRGLPEVF